MGKRQRTVKILIGTMSVVIVLIIGVIIYNLPENRLNRQLQLGQAYLVELRYEEAIIAFNEAIEIDDRCMEAYIGGIEAYLNTENTQEMMTFYERAREASKTLEGEALLYNQSFIESIYLYADQIYVGDLVKITEAFEEGFGITESEDIKGQLKSYYLEMTDIYVGQNQYDEALAIYERLLELNLENTDVLSGLSNCLSVYLEALFEQKDFEKVKEVIEKYQRYPLGLNFTDILVRVEELQKIEEENIAFMQKVYDAMANKEYEVLQELHGSEESVAFITRMEEKQYIYHPAEKGKLGVGIYLWDVPKIFWNAGKSSYYFYYGEYVDGQREGEGSTFYDDNSQDGYSYKTFEGSWQQDHPNGYGEETWTLFNSESDFYQTVKHKGNIKDGLWDGEINVEADYNGLTVKMLPYISVEGVPTEDRTEAYISSKGLSARLVPGYVYTYGHGDGEGSTGEIWDWRSVDIDYGYAMGVTGYGKYLSE